MREKKKRQLKLMTAMIVDKSMENKDGRLRTTAQCITEGPPAAWAYISIINGLPLAYMGICF